MRDFQVRRAARAVLDWLLQAARAVKAMRVPEAVIPNKNGRIWSGGYADDKWAEGEVR